MTATEHVRATRLRREIQASEQRRRDALNAMTAAQQETDQARRELGRMPCDIPRDRNEMVDHLCTQHGVLVAKRLMDADLALLHQNAIRKAAAGR